AVAGGPRRAGLRPAVDRELRHRGAHRPRGAHPPLRRDQPLPRVLGPGGHAVPLRLLPRRGRRPAAVRQRRRPRSRVRRGRRRPRRRHPRPRGCGRRRARRRGRPRRPRVPAHRTEHHMLTADPTAPHAPLTVALMSCAHTHAGSYAALLEARPDVDLVVADPDGYGDVRGVRVVPSYEEAWNAWPEGPAAIVVTSANAHHKDLVLEAARRGVHVLCEKPLAT